MGKKSEKSQTLQLRILEWIRVNPISRNTHDIAVGVACKQPIVANALKSLVKSGALSFMIVTEFDIVCNPNSRFRFSRCKRRRKYFWLKST